MDAAPGAGEELAVATAVRAGGASAFSSVTERYRRELLVHCYRMLGNLEDAEDLVQETFLRAWRNRSGFEGRSTLRAWLYRIATNACLDAIKRSRRRVRVVDVPSATDRPPSFDEVPWLQPFPDRILEDAVPGGAQPEAEVVPMASRPPPTMSVPGGSRSTERRPWTCCASRAASWSRSPPSMPVCSLHSGCRRPWPRPSPMIEHERGGERLNLLGRPVPSGFDVRVVVLWPGCERPYQAAEWRDALVEVDRGQVDLEFCSGARRRFGPGDLLWLAGLGLRALRNCEREPAALVALFRTRQDLGLPAVRHRAR